MKKVFGTIVIAAALSMMLASCTPQKEACAAYSNVELIDQDETVN